jgi:hypothetical protein
MIETVSLDRLVFQREHGGITDVQRDYTLLRPPSDVCAIFNSQEDRLIPWIDLLWRRSRMLRG